MESQKYQSWCFLFLSLFWGGLVKVKRENLQENVPFLKYSFDMPLIFLVSYMCCCICSDHCTVFCLANLNPVVWLSVSYVSFGLEVFQLQKFPYQKVSTLSWLGANPAKSFHVARVKIIPEATVFWFPALFLFLIHCNLNVHSTIPKINFKNYAKNQISVLQSNSHWN